MNDETFALLVEKYLEGSLSAEEREALHAAVRENEERARAFGHQVRQHVRLHAQTSRWDFTESQRVALLVLDEAGKTATPPPAPFLVEPTWRDALKAVFRGLRARPDTGAYRYARHVLLRLFAPSTTSVVLTVSVLLLLLLLAFPHRTEPPPKLTEGRITYLPRPALPILDPEPTIPAPWQKNTDIEPPASPDWSGIFTGPDAGDSRAPDDAHEPWPQPTRRIAWTAARPVNVAVLPGLFGGRTRQGRDFARKQFHVNPRTDPAVTNALFWLKAHQLPDGSWAGQDRAAMTGLALLTFLAHGELGDSRDFGATVQRAVDYLLAVQTGRGAFSANVYGHAIGTYALAEAQTLTRVVSLRAPLERAVQVILDGQQSEGGFDYNYGPGPRCDTSVTGWQIQALMAAQHAGVSLPGIAPAVERVAAFLETRAFALDGSGFVYAGAEGATPASGATWTMTSVGTLCLQMLEQGKTPQVRAGLKALDDLTLQWAAMPGGKSAVYGWYYATQAKFQAGGKTWEHWQDKFERELLRAQKSDGHWEGGDYDGGSHVYTTTLCALTLQVYCRYLPTFARVESPTTVATVPSNEVPMEVR